MLTINNTLDGYLKDVEIKGNTIQDIENLADIRSVGEKVEGQELYEIPVLSRGKNLFNGILEVGDISATGEEVASSNVTRTPFISIKKGINYVISENRISSSSWIKVMHYDINKKFIATKYSIDSTVDGFIRVVRHNPNQEQWNIQIEEGTVATEYEPYQEDKLTILSPVQLEKVGDVADRLIEKDGVWGVEKNVETVVLNGSENILTNTSFDGENTKVFYYSPLDCSVSSKFISDKFKFLGIDISQNPSIDKEGIYRGTANSRGVIFISIEKSKLNTQNVDGFKNWLKYNNVLIKYNTTQSQFIPLPHDQQVKLRTFANKTNISFLTEIEGTIKAQVPKSLGATVNTHTEQISNLNKELDRVKKLEESTVSTVETESDFTTVEATSNGYFEDVKLEGKTLTNIVTTYDVSRFSLLNAIKQDDGYFKLQYGATVNSSNVIPRYGVHLYKPSTTYTIVVDIKENTTGTFLGISAINSCINPTTISTRDFDNLTGISTITFKTRDDITISDKGVLPTYDLYFGIWKDGGDLSKHITFKYWVLEGDHTQNPPSYFEGLKSVGQGTDEIVVSSVNENLFDGKIQTAYINNNTFASANSSKSIVFRCEQNTDYIFSAKEEFDRSVVGGSNSEIAIGTPLSQINATKKGNSIYFNSGQFNYIAIYFNTTDSIFTEVRVIKGATLKPYTPHQSDKKRLLFYNEETQTWEKPILREWDSIEKHSDGKYYYHQRSGEVVLNGSEDWLLHTTNYFKLAKTDMKIFANTVKPNMISDRYVTMSLDNSNTVDSSISNGNGSAFIYIYNKSISTVEALKQSLQTNNVTVVYQLAQEKVYECTNIDLITYEGETNYIVESGVIVPRSTLKVHNNISNVVSLLQKKVSILESNITSYMITQNRMQLASTYSADSVTFKVDYALCSDEVEYNEDLYNLILNNILVGKDNYDYDKMFTMILDYASWNQISWEQFDILVGLMDIQHNPPMEELPPEDVIEEDIIESETPVE